MVDSAFLTTKEVAKYLKINEKKVYQLVKEGSIPCTRVAGKWLFPKALIDKWIVENVEKERDIFIAGSNDLFLWAVIEEYIKKFFPDSIVYYASIGSAKGLQALAKGKALMAATHLFDPETETYNIPFLAKYLGDENVVLINLAYREQGFLVQKGNPLNIRDFSDLIREEVRFINRNLGSGTRFLLDYHLAKEGIKADQIKGYDHEVNTHLELGLSILKGKADVGIGIRYVAELLGLEFIPIGWERFDLVCRRADFYRKPVKAFLGLLEPLNIKLFFSKKFPGYNFKDTGKIIFKSEYES